MAATSSSVALRCPPSAIGTLPRLHSDASWKRFCLHRTWAASLHQWCAISARVTHCRKYLVIRRSTRSLVVICFSLELQHQTCGPRSFTVSGPVSWNSLPPSLCSPSLLSAQFRSILKTFLFRQACGPVLPWARRLWCTHTINLRTELIWNAHVDVDVCWRSAACRRLSRRWTSTTPTLVDVSLLLCSTWHLPRALQSLFVPLTCPVLQSKSLIPNYREPPRLDLLDPLWWACWCRNCIEILLAACLSG